MQIVLYVGVTFGIVGMLLLVISNTMYYLRTKDKGYVKRFWLSKEILTKREYVLNRTGFVLTYGIIIIMASILFITRIGS